MNALATLCAIVGAALGAAAWGLLAQQYRVDLGYVAVLIGALAGLGAYAARGRGLAMGVACGLITLVGIFAARVLVVRVQLPAELRTHVENTLADKLTQDGYSEWVKDAAAFAQVGSDADYPKFMVEHGYCAAKTPAEVTRDDIASFEQTDVPVLRALHDQKLTFEQWRTLALDRATAAAFAAIPPKTVLLAALGVFSLVETICTPVAMILAFAIPAFARRKVGGGAAAPPVEPTPSRGV